MKRLHVHIIVSDLDDSLRFYQTLFDAEPSVLKDDYAKWMLDDPCVNFAISARGGAAGINHLGVQVEADELAALTGRLQSAGRAVSEQSDAACCYAKSDKTWIEDPQGVRWEAFHSTGEIAVFGADTVPDMKPVRAGEDPCCGTGQTAG
jgi:catechol 2,3-dioxygenase-like lactoylglutathione lyase family enzyme